MAERAQLASERSERCERSVKTPQDSAKTLEDSNKMAQYDQVGSKTAQDGARLFKMFQGFQGSTLPFRVFPGVHPVREVLLH